MANFSENATFQWKQKIEREITVLKMPLWGYHGILTDENSNIHVCYNLLTSVTMIAANIIGKAQTIHVTLDPQGNKEWETLHDTGKDKEKITLRPWEMTYIDNTDEILLPGSKGAKAVTFTTFRFE